MTSTYRQTAILYRFLNASDSLLKGAITGAIYSNERPNSQLEDVVVNSVDVDNEPIQQGVANVNIYVPDIQLATGQWLADEARLEELTSIASEMLNEVDVGDYVFWVDNQLDFDEPETHMHYSNLRIQFRHVNL